MPSSKTSKVVSPWRSREERQRERESKLEAVLLVAVQTFNEKGYYAASMDDVAARLQVTKPTLYHYFKNKEEILYECILQGLRILQASLDEIVHIKGGALEKLRAAVLKYAEATFTEFGTWAVRAGEEPLPAAQRTELRRVEREIDDGFRRLINDGIKEGVFVGCDTKIANSAIAGTLSWITRWYRVNGQLTPAEIAEQVYTIVINGLRVRNEAQMTSASTPARKRATSSAAKSLRVASKQAPPGASSRTSKK